MARACRDKVGGAGAFGKWFAGPTDETSDRIGARSTRTDTVDEVAVRAEHAPYDKPQHETRARPRAEGRLAKGPGDRNLVGCVLCTHRYGR